MLSRHDRWKLENYGTTPAAAERLTQDDAERAAERDLADFNRGFRDRLDQRIRERRKK